MHIEQDNSEIQKQARFRSFNYLLKISLNISIGSFYFGYSDSYFNSIPFDDIVDIYSIQNYSRALAQGVLTGCLEFMAGIGAYCSSYLLHRFSRRECFQILAYFSLITSLFLLIPNLTVLFLARMLQGLCVGMLSAIVPLYLKEFSPTELAPTLCLLHQIFLVVGVTGSFTLTFILSRFLPASMYWRIVFGFPFAISLLQLYNLKYLYPYETPKWLVLKHRQPQALDLLKVIYKEPYAEKVLQQIKEAVVEQQKKFTEPITYENQMILMGTSESSESKSCLLETKNHLNNRIITNSKVAVFTAMSLSIQQQLVGMGSIISYSGEIVGSMIPSIQQLFPVIINLISLAGVMGSIHVLKKNGRKNTILRGALLISISEFLLAYTFMHFDFNQIQSNPQSRMVLASALFIIVRVLFLVSLGPVIRMYVSEIVQPNIISIGMMINWFTLSFINTIFPIVLKQLNGNPAWIFFAFATAQFIGFLIGKQVLVETAGKSELQIRRQFDAKLS